MKLNYPCCDAMAEKSHHDNVLKLFRQKAAHGRVNIQQICSHQE